MNRRVITGLALFAMLVLGGCPGPNQAQSPEGTVVLYTSADDQLAKLLADAFTEQTGIRVQILGDTEATKTTGLVARILAEREDPQGDVWWSSEPMGTILLGDSGALKQTGMQGAAAEYWPAELVDEDWRWIGFAERARVIAYSTDRVVHPPATMRALIEPEWKGRIGMARPQFGTTRGHMALLHARWGGVAFERWIRGLKANGVRLYDGNASVVRAIAMGEIDIGLTDTDDVFAGQANGWAVDLVYESHDPPGTTSNLPSAGPTTIPNTVGIIANSPHPLEAVRLSEFLVSPQSERIIAMSASKNCPVNPELGEEFSGLIDPLREVIRFSYPDASKSVGDAMDICERTLQGP